MRFWIVACGLFLWMQPGAVYAQPARLTPVSLTSEMRVEPLGIDAPQPVFAWILKASPAGARNLRQSAYRILVSSTAERLARHEGDVWDSGRVSSAVYWQRAYAGTRLRSHTEYYWQVEVWEGEASSPGPWSKTAHFTTGLLEAGDWSAKWIAAEPDRGPSKQAIENRGEMLSVAPPPLPVFRRDFALRGAVKSALLFICGLGQYEVRLNGVNVTDTVLNPGWTDYRKTVPYDTYDVRRLLRPNANAFGVLLGNGMYNVEGVKGRYTKFVGSFGQPKLLLQLVVSYADGSSERFISDNSWTTHAGPIAYSSTYGGEDFVAGALPEGWDQPGFREPGWQHALEVDGPGGKPVAGESAPLIVAESYKPVRVTHPKPGVTVYDLGKNMSGWPAITVRGPAGATVRLRPGELLAADGTVTQHSANASAKAAVLFDYTLRGGGRVERWRPRFAYYSFRYVEATVQPAGSGVKPQILSLTGEFVHARAPVVGDFSSSDVLFDRIHTLIDRAVLSNLASVITDCPSREKLGWLEQTYLNASTILLNYGVSGLYEKMSRDMSDAQLADGLVPAIAPEYVAFEDAAGENTAFRDSPEWGSAAVLSPWALYQLTGDERPLRESYESMRRYVNYLGSRAKGGLLDYGLGDWYDIGPDPPGPSQLTGKLVTATGTYYADLKTLAQIAALLDHTQEAADYDRQAAQVKAAFNAKLFHPETNQYDRGSQTADALPLALGMTPVGREQAVLENLVADIHAHGDHVTAGDIGFHYVVRALTDYGRSDVLAAMLSRTDSPSYGYQLARGATTLTEAWDTNPDSSQNHFMLGHGEEWFYRGLAGLTFDLSRGPEGAITLAPSLLPGIGSASASYLSPMGMVRIEWRRTGSKATVDAEVPPGAVAVLRLPAGADWLASGVEPARVSGVMETKQAKDGLVLRLGSGHFHFSTAELKSQAAALK